MDMMCLQHSFPRAPFYRTQIYVNARQWSMAAILTVFILLFGGACSTAMTQGTPINVTVAVLPPYSPDLSAWETNPNRVLITLQNTDGSKSYTIRLSGSLENSDGTVTIRTKDNYPVSPVTIGAGATLTYNG